MILVLGAGYVGGALAERALAAGTDVVLADNWYATRREQVADLERRGARVVTADIRSREEVDRLVAEGPERVFLLAAQASRPLSEREPDYTEETNVTGARRVAEAVAERSGPMLVYGSSLHVYGPGLEGVVDADRPYGAQSDLAHLSKVYAELCLGLHARRGGFDLALLRLGIVYGPSPVEHDRPESQTVVDRFRRLAEAGEELPLDDDGKATIGVVHVEDAAQILLESESGVANVAAETITVADVARLARGEEPADEPAFTVQSPFGYQHTVREYLRP
ncbi:MAG: NAD-dependent epimerase/dehydratase family protein [Gaiellaceae bacterium]